MPAGKGTSDDHDRGHPGGDHQPRGYRHVTAHPLDPLTGTEIEAATSILKRDRHLKDSARFVYVTLREPDKDTVLGYRKGQPIDREANIVLRERAERKTYEAIVSLTTGDVKLWTELPSVQPAIMLEEFLATEEIVRKDPRWQEAMRRRGVNDFDMVMIDPWSVGYNGPEDDGADDGRFLRPLTWVRQGDPGRQRLRPPGRGADRRVRPGPAWRSSTSRTTASSRCPAQRQLLRGGDHRPATTSRTSPRARGRTSSRSRSSSPKAPSFTRRRPRRALAEVALRIGFTPREGLVLHPVGYEDRGRCGRSSTAPRWREMFVPYGDPRPTHYRKNVFDMGEYGIGMLANSLELGCDCLGEIRYFDAVNDNDGQAAA